MAVSFLNQVLPESTKSLERLLYHLKPSHQAILYVLLESCAQHRDDDEQDDDMVPPQALEHEELMRKVEAFSISDGNSTFRSKMVPRARVDLKKLGLIK